MRAPWLTLLAVLAVVIGACSIDAAELPATPIPTDVPTEVALATATGTWRPLPTIVVGTPQHVLTIGSKRPNLLLFTVTNSNEPDHLRAYDLLKNQIIKFKVQDVHDAYYTPDQSEIWSSSSGFIDKPSDR